MNDEDDHDLLAAWRAQPRDTPGELLDRRILQAAQIHRVRRAALPLAAAMAACLLLVFHVMRPQEIVSPTPIAQLDTATIGLYEGRGTGAVAEPEATQAMMLRRTPSTASTPTAFSP